jgi:phosphorylase/glycogen(starch) synthase
MLKSEYHSPDYLFETSWEVCNKIGGIYTVVASKAPLLHERLGDRYILIGPDVWKETRDNPDFTEDRSLFPLWKAKADSEGLKVRLGRWNIPGHPIVILVDFTAFFSMKDKIFAEFWESYHLDSITGGWDYVEPALFGYAAGKVVESFSSYHLSSYDTVAAQFHEWMTGTGILYLRKNYPRAGTVFTTHATSLGRSIAGNNLPLYRDMEEVRAESMASSLGIRSKFSLEKLAAVNSDILTTVSGLTANECQHFFQKAPDIITPNGFGDHNEIDPALDDPQRQSSREAILRVASALCGEQVPNDALLLVTSGRYEFRNKGLDVLIEALRGINQEEGKPGEVVACIAVPANQAGPNTGLRELLDGAGSELSGSGRVLSHHLHNESHDQILQQLLDAGLTNQPGSRVKVIYIPAYLNGRDGIFDIEYYMLLPAFDLSIFPSYYEPWGYTPLESLAYGVPTLTTTLTGFGMWIKEQFPDTGKALHIVPRNDDNYLECVDDVRKIIYAHQALPSLEAQAARNKAAELARHALWEKLINAYYEAYAKALAIAEERHSEVPASPAYEMQGAVSVPQSMQPVWKKVLVNLKLPERFEGLERLAKNLWWTWNPEARELFESIDPLRWEEMGENPLTLLESLGVKDYKRIEKDEEFFARYQQVLKSFEDYLNTPKPDSGPSIAYFSMEYGLHDTIKIYSGGLGMLAGDYLKEASDSNVKMVGIGLLYRYGYFRQMISLTGDQISELKAQKFTHLPVTPVRDEKGHWLTVRLALPGRSLHAKVWQCMVGRIPLYLMDTDIEENEEHDRSITHQLYGGDWETRFKQELLLGVGGIRMLAALGLQPDLYHCNEGHAAFIGVERLRWGVQEENLSFGQALEVVRASTLFTTHTPVPAGHDYFSEDILRTYIPHYSDRLNISWEEFMDLGRFQPGNTGERFSMSVLAAKLSSEMNGVSAIHGKVSRDMFRALYPGYFADELHIGHVTNGVHYPTWTGRRWQRLHREVFGDAFFADQSNPAHWEKIQEVPDQKIWEIRNHYRRSLMKYVRKRISADMTRRQESPGLIVNTLEALDEDALTIGFARRFATYKRAHLLFTNLPRLSKLVNDPARPVQFLFAGKAHPADKAGQDLIKRIIEISRMPEFLGKVVFIENYDIELGKKLIQGVDVWLNTPTRPLEASGTSGEKAVMNGVVNFSVLDGWWAEGYREDAGWAIREERTYDNQDFQNQLDAETIYNTFEEQIIPLFYDRNSKGIPIHWVGYVKNTIAGIAPHFTMKRMLDDYMRKYYLPQFDRASRMRQNNYAAAHSYSEWKSRMMIAWNNIEVASVLMPDSTVRPLELGERFHSEVILVPNMVRPEDVGVEVIFGRKNDIGEVTDVLFRQEMRMKEQADGTLSFSCNFPVTQVGVFDYAFRIFPRYPDMPHRMDFPLVKWV